MAEKEVSDFVSDVAVGAGRIAEGVRDDDDPVSGQVEGRGQQQNLQTVHAQIARMAADSYTSGGLDPVLGFASAKDPREADHAAAQGRPRPATEADAA
jgi:hypothetical protein